MKAIVCYIVKTNVSLNGFDCNKYLFCLLLLLFQLWGRQLEVTDKCPFPLNIIVGGFIFTM